MLLTGAAVWMVVGPTPEVPAYRRVDGPTAALTVAVGASAFAIGLGIGAGPTVAIALGAVGALIVPGAVASRARRRQQDTAALWPDFLATVRARLAAGDPLPAATLTASRRTGGPFSELAEALEPAHAAASFTETLAAVRDRWQDPLADRVLGTLSIAADIGGGQVADVLAALSSSVADELRLRLAHEAATTQQRLTALVALIAPWVLLALTVASNPTAAEAFASPGGRAVVVGGLAATLIGFALTRRTLRLSDTPRISA